MPTLIGQPLLAGQTAQTPWRSVPGEAATFVIQVLAAENSTDLQVVVQTKNADELDSAAVTATSGSFTISSAGVTSQRVTGLKQLVRVKLTATGEGLADEEFVQFRILQVLWETN